MKWIDIILNDKLPDKYRWSVGLPMFIVLVLAFHWYTNKYTMKDSTIEVVAIEILRSCNHIIRKRKDTRLLPAPCALVTTTTNILQLKKTSEKLSYGHEDPYDLLLKLRVGCRYAVSVIGIGPIPQTFAPDTKHQIVKAQLLTKNQSENCTVVASR